MECSWWFEKSSFIHSSNFPFLPCSSQGGRLTPNWEVQTSSHLQNMKSPDWKAHMPQVKEKGRGQNPPMHDPHTTYTVRTQGSIPPTVPWVPKSCCLFHTVPLHVQGSPLSLHNILGPQCLRSKRLYVLTQLTPSLSPHKSPSSSCFPLSLCSTDLWDQTNRNGLYLESAVYNISAWRCRNRESSSPHSPHSTRLFQLSRVKLPIFLYAEITTNAPNERKMHTHEWLLCQQKCSAMIFKIKKIKILQYCCNKSHCLRSHIIRNSQNTSLHWEVKPLHV